MLGSWCSTEKWSRCEAVNPISRGTGKRGARKEEKVLLQLRKGRQAADVVIVKEHSQFPFPFQEELAGG